jgi:hypothetical protein
MKENQNTCGECGVPAIGLCRRCERRLSAEADYYANCEPVPQEEDTVCPHCHHEWLPDGSCVCNE